MEEVGLGFGSAGRAVLGVVFAYCGEEDAACFAVGDAEGAELLSLISIY